MGESFRGLASRGCSRSGCLRLAHLYLEGKAPGSPVHAGHVCKGQLDQTGSAMRLMIVTVVGDRSA